MKPGFFLLIIIDKVFFKSDSTMSLLIKFS